MVRRREFTYREKKFNSLGRRGLTDYFKQKYDPEKIRMLFLTEHHYTMSVLQSKAIALKLEQKFYEENKDFIESLVDGILHLSEMFDLKNVEAFALWCYIMKDLGQLHKQLGREPTEQESAPIIDKSIRTHYELYRQDPNKFLDILKIFK